MMAAGILPLMQTMTTPSVPLAFDTQKLGLLLAAVLLVAAPHAQNLAPPVSAFFALLTVWRFASLYLRWPLPNRAVLFLLTLVGAAIVFGQYRRIWGPEAGSSLFLTGLGLKLMEMKSQREGYLVVYLAFFVALTQYLFSQSIPMAGYTFAVVILLVAAMIGLNSNAAFPVKARLKMAATMVALSVPVMVVLFILFPRVQGPLWQLPDDRHTAKTGLSDTLSPGSVSQLAHSEETAFRVDFDSGPPPPRQRYWRGPVFWTTDGTHWSIAPDVYLDREHRPRIKGGVYSYTITLEPHRQRWIFALELPQTYGPDFYENTDYQLLAKKDVNERMQYRLTSGTLYQTGPLDDRERRLGLQLPAHVSPKVDALVKSWLAEDTSPQKLVNRALRFFHEEKFFYTLNPPLLVGDPVEGFLLGTRRGFCEHYATAFVVLMRLGGVPARVVTGYQGGQWNSLGQFLEVKQGDAHAWAEVWLEGSGWTRVDPTAAVAPDRIEHGLDLETQAAEGEIRFALSDAIGGSNARLGKFWHRLRMLGSSIDHAWDSWVLAYGADNQRDFFKWLGLMDWRSLAAWLSGCAVVFLLAALWLSLPKRRASTDPAKRLYDRFLDKLAQRGLPQQVGEGPLAFAGRVADSQQELADPVQRITRLYLRIRYEATHRPDDLKTLRRLIQTIPVRRKKTH
jgi:transglutaminase-like putative cysteine protease